MKKYICHLAVMAGMLCMSSCFEDDSKQGSPMNDIEISGIESNYLATSYVGEVLEIAPTVTTGYADNELEYTWMLLNSSTGKSDESGNTVEPEIIGRDKNLAFDVAVAPGSYQIRYEVKVTETSYSVYATTSLLAVTEFSQGFYIMKETVSGATDLDLLASSGAFSEDLIAQTQGEPLQGKPFCLNPLYGHYYVNPETDQMEHTHMLAVTTEAGEVNVLRSSDLMKVFDRHSLLYGDMEADEQPVSIFRAGMSAANMVYASSKGFRSNTAYGYLVDAGWNSPCVGKYGYPLEEGLNIGRYAFTDPNGGFFFWEENSHSLMYMDYSMYAYPLLDYAGGSEELTQNLTGYRCVGAGANTMLGMFANFVLENTTTKERYIYFGSSNFIGMYFDGRMKISEDSHMGKSEVFSTNGLTANLVYCIDDNKLWACNLNSDDLAEQEVPLQGISANETLTYVSNQYWTSYFAVSNTYDYLVVGTQEGSKYHVYMYEMIGGIPEGAPVQTITGTGTVKSVRFLSAEYNDYDVMFGLKVYPEMD